MAYSTQLGGLWGTDSIATSDHFHKCQRKPVTKGKSPAPESHNTKIWFTAVCICEKVINMSPSSYSGVSSSCRYAGTLKRNMENEKTAHSNLLNGWLSDALLSLWCWPIISCALHVLLTVIPTKQNNLRTYLCQSCFLGVLVNYDTRQT